MIRLPFVSRGRYEDMRERAEAAEARAERAEDQLTRLARVSNGRPEVAPDQKETSEPETLPKMVRDQIAGYSSTAIQDTLRREAWQARQQGKDWGEIAAELGAQAEGV